MEERERWRRERRHEEETTQQGWTVVHSLAYIVVTFPTSHAERSPLNCFACLNTDDGEDIERGGGGGGGETSVSVGSEMEKRERDGGDMRKTTHGWTVVHSLYDISVTFPTSHAERSPLN